MTEKAKKPEETIEPGMVVEATRGDLGEEDVSKPKVTEVVEDQQNPSNKKTDGMRVCLAKSLSMLAKRKLKH